MARAGAVCEIVLNMRREESRPNRLDLHKERTKIFLHYLTVFLVSCNLIVYLAH